MPQPGGPITTCPKTILKPPLLRPRLPFSVHSYLPPTASRSRVGYWPEMAAARGRVGFWPEKAAAPPPASQADTSGIPKERDREGFGTAWLTLISLGHLAHQCKAHSHARPVKQHKIYGPPDRCTCLAGLQKSSKTGFSWSPAKRHKTQQLHVRSRR